MLLMNHHHTDTNTRRHAFLGTANFSGCINNGASMVNVTSRKLRYKAQKEMCTSHGSIKRLLTVVFMIHLTINITNFALTVSTIITYTSVSSV